MPWGLIEPKADADADAKAGADRVAPVAAAAACPNKRQIATELNWTEANYECDLQFSSRTMDVTPPPPPPPTRWSLVAHPHQLRLGQQHHSISNSSSRNNFPLLMQNVLNGGSNAPCVCVRRDGHWTVRCRAKRATKCRWVAFLMQWKCKNQSIICDRGFRSLCPLWEHKICFYNCKTTTQNSWMQFATTSPPHLLLPPPPQSHSFQCSAYLSVFNLSKQIQIWIEFVVVVPCRNLRLSPPSYYVSWKLA